MELVVSVIGILLCVKDRKRLRLFLIAFVIMLISSVYMRVLSGGVLKMLHDMDYDTTGQLFKVLLWAIPLMMNIGFYCFLLLGIAGVRTRKGGRV